jgi:3-hydroxymyristoyl/3-hydroxydecanoyl-(acyl carrier protein) dehydratase
VENQWRLLGEVKAIDHNNIEALAHVPEDSPWFSGHFPGEPILPGVAIVHIAEQAIIKDAESRGDAIHLNALKRVRFTQPVRPGEVLSIHINRDEADERELYSFKVLSKENIVCSGVIVAGKKKRL